MEHAGIECTTLMCLSERSNLRASMHNALSMAFCVSVGPIEHRRRTAATESVRKHSQPTHPLTFEPTEGTRDGVELPQQLSCLHPQIAFTASQIDGTIFDKYRGHTTTFTKILIQKVILRNFFLKFGGNTKKDVSHLSSDRVKIMGQSQSLRSFQFQGSSGNIF